MDTTYLYHHHHDPQVEIFHEGHCRWQKRIQSSRSTVIGGLGYRCCCCKHFGCEGAGGCQQRHRPILHLNFANLLGIKKQVPVQVTGTSTVVHVDDKVHMFTPTTNKLNEYQTFKNTKTISLHPDWLQSMPSTFYYNAIPQS